MHLLPSRNQVLFLARTQIEADIVQHYIVMSLQKGSEPPRLKEVVPNSKFTNETEVDEVLLAELIDTLLQPSVTPELYQVAASLQVKEALEENLAEQLVKAYRDLKIKQQDPLVQVLNKLVAPT